MAVEQQYKDLMAVIGGRKPLVIVEKRKAPQTYSEVSEIIQDDGGFLSTYTEHVELPEGPAWFVAEDSHRLACALTHAHDLAWYRRHATRALYQSWWGWLLGYSQEDREAWAAHGWHKCHCECSLCGGPIIQDDSRDMPYDTPEAQEWARESRGTGSNISRLLDLPGKDFHSINKLARTQYYAK